MAPLDLSVGKLSQVITRNNQGETTNNLSFNFDLPSNFYFMKVLLIAGGGGGQGSSSNGATGAPSTIKYRSGPLVDGEYCNGGQGGGQNGTGPVSGGNGFIWDDVSGVQFTQGLKGTKNEGGSSNTIGNAGNGGFPYTDMIGGGHGGILQRVIKASDINVGSNIAVVIGHGGAPGSSFGSPGFGGACIIEIYTK